MKNSAPPTYESADARWRRGLDPQMLLGASPSNDPIDSATKSTATAGGRSMRGRRKSDPKGPWGPWWVTAAIVAAVVMLVAAAVLEYLALPLVYFSPVTGCVAVENPKDPGASCARLPAKYVVVWVH